jgi:hypothetical protein
VTQNFEYHWHYFPWYLPSLPYHCRESIVSPGRALEKLVVTVSLGPILSCAMLATVVVRPGGVILSE